MPQLYGTLIFQWSNHNLLPEAIDFSAWDVSGTPVLTAGQADPYGGTAAYLVGDDNAGAVENINDQGLNYQTTGVKGFGIFVKEGDTVAAAGSRIVFQRDGVAIGDYHITGWVDGNPTIAMQSGTELFKRQRQDGWWHIGVSGTASPVGLVRCFIYPARTSAEQGDIRVYGAQVVDQPTIGGYFQTDGTAVAYDGSTAQEFLSRVPLQNIRIGTAQWRGVGESADRLTREVVTIGAGVQELAARLRYEDDRALFAEFIHEAMKGYKVYVVPVSASPDTAKEVMLVEPKGMEWMESAEVDYQAFREVTLDVRFRSTDTGNFAALLS